MRSKSYKKDNSNKKGDSKSKSKNFGKSSKEYAQLDNRGRDNDPNFYFSNAELAQQAAQLSFQNMVGLGTLEGYKVPSMCKVLLNPCPGVTVDPGVARGDMWMGTAGYRDNITQQKRGINLMSSKLYTMLSTFTGRTSQYAPQDVAMMILAISSIAELSEHIRRMFGIALTYNPRNRNLPLGLLRTMNVNVDDFIHNIPVYRMRFNVAMTRINQIPLLDNIGYIRKSREIYQRVYMDSPSPMSQIFYYAPRSVWRLNETLVATGSVLEPVIVSGSNLAPLTVGNLMTILESMITALLESSTLNLIYADLLNMANKINVPVWQFDYLAENYIVMPEYNRNALLQFHHMRALGDPQTLKSGEYVMTKQWKYDDTDPSNVYRQAFPITTGNYVVSDPDTNNVVYNPTFNDHAFPYAVVDMDNPNPTLEDRIEALRFTSIPSGGKVLRGDLLDTSNTTLLDVLMALPDHYVTYLMFYDNVDYTETPNMIELAYSVDTSISASPSYMEKFSQRPFAYAVDWTQHKLVTLWGDLDFYTMVDFDYLARVNELMYTGLFDFRV